MLFYKKEYPNRRLRAENELKSGYSAKEGCFNVKGNRRWRWVQKARLP
jgi:hypothetical protein